LRAKTAKNCKTTLKKLSIRNLRAETGSAAAGKAGKPLKVPKIQGVLQSLPIEGKRATAVFLAYLINPMVLRKWPFGGVLPPAGHGRASAEKTTRYEKHWKTPPDLGGAFGAFSRGIGPVAMELLQ
jgi:hypothetical protein